MTEPTDWLTYVTPVLKHPKKGQPLKFDPTVTFDAPRFYPTNALYLWYNVKPGDRIWMLGVLRVAGRTLAPAIDGLLVVKKKHKRTERPPPAGPGSPVSDRSYWFEADTGSEWFPWADATGLVPKCGLARKNGSERHLPGKPEIGGEEGKGWWKTWGNLLRPGSKVRPSAARKIEAHVETIKKKSVFVSYSWEDGAPLAARFVEIISDRKHSVWLDRFSGPRQMAHGLAKVETGRLGPFLTMALDSCAAFALIDTPCTRRKQDDSQRESWCLHEVREARRLKKPGVDVEVTIDRGLKRGQNTESHEAILQRLATEVLADLNRRQNM